MSHIDRAMRIMVLAGQIAQAAGKGANQSGESDEWGSGLRDWDDQLMSAAYALEQEARAIYEERGIKPWWVLNCKKFRPREGAFNGSCGNCRHFDWQGNKCRLRGEQEG